MRFTTAGTLGSVIYLQTLLVNGRPILVSTDGYLPPSESLTNHLDTQHLQDKQSAFHHRPAVIAPSSVVINHSEKVDNQKREEVTGDLGSQLLLQKRSPAAGRVDAKELGALRAATDSGAPAWLHVDRRDLKGDSASLVRRGFEGQAQSKGPTGTGFFLPGPKKAEPSGTGVFAPQYDAVFPKSSRRGSISRPAKTFGHPPLDYRTELAPTQPSYTQAALHVGQIRSGVVLPTKSPRPLFNPSYSEVKKMSSKEVHGTKSFASKLSLSGEESRGSHGIEDLSRRLGNLLYRDPKDVMYNQWSHSHIRRDETGSAGLLRRRGISQEQADLGSLVRRGRGGGTGITGAPKRFTEQYKGIKSTTAFKPNEARPSAGQMRKGKAPPSKSRLAEEGPRVDHDLLRKTSGLSLVRRSNLQSDEGEAVLEKRAPIPMMEEAQLSKRGRSRGPRRGLMAGSTPSASSSPVNYPQPHMPAPMPFAHPMLHPQPPYYAQPIHWYELGGQLMAHVEHPIPVIALPTAMQHHPNARAPHNLAHSQRQAPPSHRASAQESQSSRHDHDLPRLPGAHQVQRAVDEAARLSLWNQPLSPVFAPSKPSPGAGMFYSD